MAEFLIKAVDATNADPLKDQRGCYKRGDIVDVRPDGFRWGKEECLPRFVIVKVPGLDPKTVMHLMAEYRDGDGLPGITKRRLWRVLVDAADLPLAVKTSLRNTGSVTVTLAQIKAYVQNKGTGATL